MHDENLHIIRDRLNSLPEPTIPVDTAWRQMESLLDAEDGKPAGSDRRLSLLVIMVLLLFIYLLNGDRHSPVKRGMMGIEPHHFPDSPYFSWSGNANKLHLSGKKRGTPFSTQHNPGSPEDPADWLFRRDLKSEILSYLKPRESTKRGAIQTMGNGDRTGLAFEKATDSPKDGLLNVTKTVLTGPGITDTVETTYNIGKKASGYKMENKNPNSLTSTYLSRADELPIRQKSGIKIKAPALLEKYGITSQVHLDSLIGARVADHAHNMAGGLSRDSMEITAGEDSTIKRAGQKIPHEKNWTFGLEWSLAMPAPKSRYYMTGPSGNLQPYRLLIPGVWIGKDFGRHTVSFGLNPASQIQARPVLLGTDTMQRISGDTSLVLESSYFYKGFGFQGRIRYNYRLSDKLSIGAGLAYNRNSNTLHRKITERIGDGQQLGDSIYTMRDGTAGGILNRGFMTGNLELVWENRSYNFGIRTSVPVSRISKVPDTKIRPLSMEIFFRWALYRKRS